jgi:hypothetical protein
MYFHNMFVYSQSTWFSNILVCLFIVSQHGEVTVRFMYFHSMFVYSQSPWWSNSHIYVVVPVIVVNFIFYTLLLNFLVWLFMKLFMNSYCPIVRMWKVKEQVLVLTPTLVSFAFGAALTTVLPIVFQCCCGYCYSDSQNLWAVMKAGGLAL